MGVRYQKASVGELRSAAFHDAMADVHGMISLEHGDKSISAPKGSEERALHNSIANAHATLSEHQFNLARSGTFNVTSSRVMRVKKNPSYSMGKQIGN